ncbi:MAG TPA: tyrosinase family protein [Rhizomicrobium sp.]|jgi:tyrosinase
MRKSNSGFTRRYFLETGAAAAAASTLPFGAARAAAKYVRYPVNTSEGQKMLDSYREAIAVMRDLGPQNPHNWFRNAFVHTYDCPHHNWWFLVWHRGYMGWFERTVRRYSKNQSFAFPYWDWSVAPRVPAGMFDGVLTPTDGSFGKYTSDEKTFQNFIGPSLEAYWTKLTDVQSKLLRERDMATTKELWEQVEKRAMFAKTPFARYPSKDKPDLDDKTTDATSGSTVAAIMKAPDFETFNSGQTKDHGQVSTDIAALEGTPHDLTHNFCGGAGLVPLDQMGFMQDNLSPSDPLFFLHHANMDRLWHNWTQSQIAAGKPYKPKDIDKFMTEPFPFFVDENGKALVDAKASDYFDIGRFDYEYAEPKPVVVAARAPVPASLRGTVAGAMNKGVASLAVPPGALAKDRVLVVHVTIPNPPTLDSPREFLVLANAPAGTTTATPASPYYVGAVAFFGFMPGMAGATTFTVPIPADKASRLAPGPLQIQAVPVPPVAAAKAAPHAAGETMRATRPTGAAPGASALKGASLTVW